MRIVLAIIVGVIIVFTPTISCKDNYQMKIDCCGRNSKQNINTVIDNISAYP